MGALTQKILPALTTGDRDKAVELWVAWEAQKKQDKERDAIIKAAFIEFCESYGDLELPGPEPKRLYPGTVKRTKCKDTRVTFEALLELTGGDIDSIHECMSSGAFKHGACRKVLGDSWGDHFSVEEVKDLKTGKPKKALLLTDDRYTTR